MNKIEKLELEEHGYPDRIEIGKEAINVLEIWYGKLLEMGYAINNDKLVRISDNKEIAMIHNVENQRIGVLPSFSYL